MKPLPKNRMVLLLVTAIGITLAFIFSGVYHINKMAQLDKEAALTSYNKISDSMAFSLGECIRNNYLSVQASANIAGQTGEMTKEKIMTILPLLAQDRSYMDLAIVDMSGSGYNIKGNSINISKEEFFHDFNEKEINISTDKVTYVKNQEPVFRFVAPIKSGADLKGILIATISANLDNLGYLEENKLEDSLLFILNGKNEVISCEKGYDASGFNYDKLILSGTFFNQDENKSSDLNLNNLFGLINQPTNEYIWYQKPIKVNNWTLFIGVLNQINPIVQENVTITNLNWAFVLIIIVLLFIMLVSNQKFSSRKVNQMLYLDPVTGGDNWYKFRIDVNKILNRRFNSKRKFALINFDINRFKIINDAFGYQRGDEVLKDIYAILKKWVKQEEPFTRYSADQFYVLVTFQNEKDIIRRIKLLNEKLHQLKDTHTIKFYFGIYYITDKQNSIDRMGDFASMAKNKIKGSNEEYISFFGDVDKKRLLEEEEIEKTMYDALKNNEFLVYLQPKVNSKEETITGAEALVRWMNQKGRMVSPGYFIPVFEKNGFIIDLDLYMLRKVCEILREWLDKGCTPIPISVNISRINFANPNLAQVIRNIVDEYQVPHEFLELELTESAFLQNKEMLIQTVVLLRAHGFIVSMDDFGAGYSSLNSLKDIPLDALKLDGEMFKITDEVERGLTVIRNTISMAKELHMKVVAECIETREQVEYLCSIGCDIIQGFYFAKPMSIELFETKYLFNY